MDKNQSMHVHGFMCMDCPLIILIKIFFSIKKNPAHCKELIIYTVLQIVEYFAAFLDN